MTESQNKENNRWWDRPGPSTRINQSKGFLRGRGSIRPLEEVSTNGPVKRNINPSKDSRGNRGSIRTLEGVSTNDPVKRNINPSKDSRGNRGSIRTLEESTPNGLIGQCCHATKQPDNIKITDGADLVSSNPIFKPGGPCAAIGELVGKVESITDRLECIGSFEGDLNDTPLGVHIKNLQSDIVGLKTGFIEFAREIAKCVAPVLGFQVVQMADLVAMLKQSMTDSGRGGV